MAWKLGRRALNRLTPPGNLLVGLISFMLGGSVIVASATVLALTVR